MNLPNALTLSRIGFALILIYLLLLNSFVGNVWAAIVFFVAALTDFYDGYFAKKRGLITDFGKIMDPISDKVLTLSIFFVFADIGMVAWWMVFLIAVREIAVTIDRLYCMRKGHVLAAERSGKIKTVFQIMTISIILLYLILDQAWFANTWFYQIQKPYLGWINGFMVITVLLTLSSGYSYLKTRRNLA